MLSLHKAINAVFHDLYREPLIRVWWNSIWELLVLSQLSWLLAISTDCTKPTSHKVINRLIHVFHETRHRFCWSLTMRMILLLKYEFCSFYSIHFVFWWTAVYERDESKLNKLQTPLGISRTTLWSTLFPIFSYFISYVYGSKPGVRSFFFIADLSSIIIVQNLKRETCSRIYL
jgi:hypothetical protein